MSNEEIKNKINGWYADITFVEEGVPYLTVEMKPDLLKELAGKLKENTDCAFNYLFCITGVDYGSELGVTYFLESTEKRHNIILKTKISGRENAELDSVTDVWPAAYLHELEVFDLFGIKFKGHPDLYRLFLGEDWEGYPLRKDYVDNVNMIIRD